MIQGNKLSAIVRMFYISSTGKCYLATRPRKVIKTKYLVTHTKKTVSQLSHGTAFKIALGLHLALEHTTEKLQASQRTAIY